MRGNDDLSSLESVWEYRHPDREGEFFGIDLEEGGFPSWILREVIDA